MGKQLNGTIALGIQATILYLVTFFCMPIYERLWLQFITFYFPLFDLFFFGIVLLIMSLSFLLAALLTNSIKRLRRNGFVIAFLFLLLNAIPYLLPIWFNSFWVF